MAHIKTKIYAVDLLRRFDRFYGCWLNINIYSERTERGAHASVSEYYSNGTVPHSHLRWNCLSNYCLLGNKKWIVSLIVVLTVLISSQDKNCILYFTKEDVNSSKKVGNDKNMENILNSQRYLALKKFNDLKKKFFFSLGGNDRSCFQSIFHLLFPLQSLNLFCRLPRTRSRAGQSCWPRWNIRVVFQT